MTDEQAPPGGTRRRRRRAVGPPGAVPPPPRADWTDVPSQADDPQPADDDARLIAEVPPHHGT